MYSYESELRSDTLLFSKNGNYLSYLSFNITDVRQYRWVQKDLAGKCRTTQLNFVFFFLVFLFIFSFTVTYNEREMYPRLQTLKYPKTGTRNPVVTVNVIDVSAPGGKIGYPKNLYIPFKYSSEYYVGGLAWVSNNELAFICTDRNQTKAVTYLCKAPTFECVEVLTSLLLNYFYVLCMWQLFYSLKTFLFFNFLH